VIGVPALLCSDVGDGWSCWLPSSSPRNRASNPAPIHDSRFHSHPTGAALMLRRIGNKQHAAKSWFRKRTLPELREVDIKTRSRQEHFRRRGPSTRITIKNTATTSRPTVQRMDASGVKYDLNLTNSSRRLGQVQEAIGTCSFSCSRVVDFSGMNSCLQKNPSILEWDLTAADGHETPISSWPH